MDRDMLAFRDCLCWYLDKSFCMVGTGLQVPPPPRLSPLLYGITLVHAFQAVHAQFNP